MRLKFCQVELVDQCVWTRFHDGTCYPATPHWTPHYLEITARLGYGDDVLAYCLFHEAAHSFVEEKLHNRPSSVLWALAHGTMLSGHDAAYEEAFAQMFQRWVHANELPIIGGIDWHSMKAEFLDLCGA